MKAKRVLAAILTGSLIFTAAPAYGAESASEIYEETTEDQEIPETGAEAVSEDLETEAPADLEESETISEEISEGDPSEISEESPEEAAEEETGEPDEEISVEPEAEQDKVEVESSEESVEGEAEPVETEIEADGEETVSIDAMNSTATIVDRLISQVSSYSYELIPLVEPFNNMFYLKTENPDVEHLRLRDMSSSYYETEGDADGVLTISTTEYADVVYEDLTTKRVNGGYLVESAKEDTDGGKYKIELEYNGTWYDTNLRVKTSALMTSYDYLYNEYVDESKGFFENLDNLQTALEELAVYPKDIVRDDKTLTSYPYYMSSVWDTNGIKAKPAEYESYYGTLLMEEAYPFILDSLSFPGTIEFLARKMDSACTSSDTGYHWLIDITLNGTTRRYGGAGEGSTNSLLYSTLEKGFDFSFSDSDYAKKSLQAYRDKLVAYGESSDEILNATGYLDQLQGEKTKEQAAAGAWFRIIQENGRSKNFSFFYINVDGDLSYADDCWVDGRYIDRWSDYEAGASFTDEDLSKKNIIIPNMTFTDCNGVTRTEAVVFEYNEARDAWYAVKNYYRKSMSLANAADSLPDTMVLTRAEVTALSPDKNTSTDITNYYIYDGSAEPGTPSTDVKQNISWKFSDGTLTISGEGAMEDYGEPLENYPDDYVGQRGATIHERPWEAEIAKIKKVVIKEGVTYIGAGAFNRCVNLTSVKIADTVTSIGLCAFSSCTSLKTLVLPDSVRSLGVSVFGSCEALETITWSKNLTEIGANCFLFCSSLKEITLPKALKKVGVYAFGYCDGLKEVTIWGKLKEIPGYMFVFCSNLSKVTLKEGVQSIGTMAFARIAANSSVIIPKSVTTIKQDAIEDNTTICGYKGSQAQKYAKTYELSFFSLAAMKTPTVKNNTIKGVTLKWSKYANAMGYQIYRKASGESSYTKIKTIYTYNDASTWSSNTLTYTDTKAKNGKYYAYKIRPIRGEKGGPIVHGVFSSVKTICYLAPAAKIKAIKKSSGKKAVVSWKAVSSVQGYQIRYSQNDSMKNAKTVTVKGKTTLKKTVKFAKAKTKYYFQIRTYKKVKGKTYYSAWTYLIEGYDGTKMFHDYWTATVTTLS